MGILFTAEVGKLLTRLLGNYLTAILGKVLDIYKYPEGISFEQKYPIDESFQFYPNVDVIIKDKKGIRYKIYAIECKFSEAYSTRRHTGIKQKYIDLSNIWQDIPNLYELAKSINPIDNLYNHLHPAQLIKHILGLKKKYGTTGFRLLYLWYDTLGSLALFGCSSKQGLRKIEDLIVFEQAP